MNIITQRQKLKPQSPNSYTRILVHCTVKAQKAIILFNSAQTFDFRYEYTAFYFYQRVIRLKCAVNGCFLLQKVESCLFCKIEEEKTERRSFTVGCKISRTVLCLYCRHTQILKLKLQELKHFVSHGILVETSIVDS